MVRKVAVDGRKIGKKWDRDDSALFVAKHPGRDMIDRFLIPRSEQLLLYGVRSSHFAAVRTEQITPIDPCTRYMHLRGRATSEIRLRRTTMSRCLFVFVYLILFSGADCHAQQDKQFSFTRTV